ncbi:glycosyltransferase family 2 protein [Thiocystis violascens]|uniref:Putative glycosyltransferase n=1 Tax=Thiocystis violascens (strain ATCC 17096 / DSM 198 / 6111) TaxID=765911 RepID=I3YC86_THIV6|nr:glycosyltransferase family 2 protein [Thiocystis violascens]AFL74604.1 putative glycosyltransferase [Thiocystis violascens DSM 198]
MPKSDTSNALAPAEPAVSVLIVNYNAGALLADCVAAVLESSLGLQVLIGDNGSSDDSLRAVRARFGDDPRLTLVEHGANLGFAAGNNRLLHLAQAPYLLFLNPDCIVQPHTLERMLHFMDATPDAGMAGCVIRDPDGTEQVASRRAIPDPWIGLVRVLRLDRLWPTLTRGKRLNLTDQPLPDQPTRVAAISGSFMLVRRAALKAVGPLDTGYFLHCEDLDWFVRFARAGWGIYLVPDAEAIHHKGACSHARPLRVEWHKHRGMARFFRKFQRDDYPRLFGLLVLIGIWGHFAAVATLLGARRMGRILMGGGGTAR